MAARKKPCKQAASPAQPGLPSAFYHLHALLETVRDLQCCEDDLCSLLAEIKRTGKLSSRARRDLLDVLHSVPAMRLQAEMDACFEALEQAAA